LSSKTAKAKPQSLSLSWSCSKLAGFFENSRKLNHRTTISEKIWPLEKPLEKNPVLVFFFIRVEHSKVIFIGRENLILKILPPNEVQNES